MLRTRDLNKVYRTGEVEVHALRGVSLDLFPADLVVKFEAYALAMSLS